MSKRIGMTSTTCELCLREMTEPPVMVVVPGCRPEAMHVECADYAVRSDNGALVEMVTTSTWKKIL